MSHPRNAGDDPPAEAAVLWLPDGATGADVATFAARAKRIDAAGALRLTAHGSVLAVTACALHGAGGPTVLAMRVLTLAEPSDVDATVPLASLTDRLAWVEPEAGTGRLPVPLPPASAVRAAWAGLLPPRRGWERVGSVSLTLLSAAAREGIAAVAAGTPEGAGAVAVARLRAGVWGRPLAGFAGVPTGVAFAAEAFGFIGSAGPQAAGGASGSAAGGSAARDLAASDSAASDSAASDSAASDSAADGGANLHRAGPWVRLSTERGHVLARPPVALLG